MCVCEKCPECDCTSLALVCTRSLSLCLDWRLSRYYAAEQSIAPYVAARDTVEIEEVDFLTRTGLCSSADSSDVLDL